MSSARDAILGTIRNNLKRGPVGDDRRAGLEERLANPTRNLIPARARIPQPEQVELFKTMVVANAATLEEVASAADVPEAVARYLSQHNLPAHARIAPDPRLTGIDWHRAPTLEIEAGTPAPNDLTSVTAALSGIAETGTLALPSSPESPTTLNFLPDNHIVVLRKSQVVGIYEEVWDLIRAQGHSPALPRTVNFISGPSRTGDIEQVIQLGAHGPRRQHVLLIDTDDA